MPRGDGTGPPTWGRGGRGRGAGGGGDGGRRRRAGQRGGNAPTEPPPLAQPTKTADEQELTRLKRQAAAMEEQLAALGSRPAATEGGEPRTVAIINEDRCTLCGVCEAVCPTGAITLADATTVNAGKCSGCGACVEACPSEAIALG